MSLSVKFDNAHNYSDTALCTDGSLAYTHVSTEAHNTVGIYHTESEYQLNVNWLALCCLIHIIVGY